ncbi:MAG TPA: acyltransferase [Rhizomicrobium sp.]|nr:acyltransferase [Rhizomicrobium sp.]
MKRLHALDSLRGLAALSIVVWHWQHFQAISGEWPDDWQRSAQPLYWLLKPLYDEGWAAVDLFFPLSGFIFFWLYGAAIREGSIGLGRFARLRFSRLYPLHLATLASAAILQFFFLRATGHFFIYDANDLPHFASGLVMAQQWLPPTIEQSFNGPAWSVSVEVLLYGLFFVSARFGFRGVWPALGVAGLGIALLHWNLFIARGVMGFFLGGAVYFLDRRILKRADAARIARWVGYAALVLWIVVWIEAYLHPLHALLPPQSNDDLFLLLFIFGVSPVTILALALREQVLGASWERLSFLGDISYSTYMLHFPMQLGLALIAAHTALTPDSFESPLALVAFYAVLIGLGALCFRFFERPLQNRLRASNRAGDSRGS